MANMRRCGGHEPFSLHLVPRDEDTQHFGLVSIGYFIDKPPTACVRLKGHTVEALVYTVGGAAHGDIGHKKSMATAGSLWITPKDQPYVLRPDEKVGYWEGQWIEFDGAWVRPLWSMLGLRGVSHIPAVPDVGPIMDEIFDLLQAEGDHAQHLAAALVWKLFALAERRLVSAAVADDPVYAAVENVKKHIQKNLDGELTLEGLAKLACMSRFHFERVFRRQTGFTPFGYVRSLRISRAQELLRRGGLRVGEVGRRVGYPQIHHFSAVFSKTVGVSPREFRRSIVDA